MEQKIKIVVTGLVLVVAFTVAQSENNRSKREAFGISEKMSFFITSINPGNGGNLGGLEGADAYCKQLAESVGVPGKTWRAYLSTKTSNAKDRIGNGPWYNAKGELIAKDLEELHGTNFLNKQTALNEKGKSVSGRGDTPNEHDILTGSTYEGLAVATSTDTTCSDWTSGTQGSATVGHHDRIGINESAPMKSWNSSHLTRGCSVEAFRTTGGAGLYYCFAK
ncbi:MAG: hypothetical protein QG653_425 [Patescibacteria group bacterium]|nr:hypothetical protein [Patescibacteria group bacterium]